MSSSPVIILNPPATRDSYEYYYYEYDDDGGDQEFGQSEKIERTGQSTLTEAPAAASEVVAAEAADDQAASGLFFGGLFGSDKCPYCDKGGYQKEPCCPHVVDGPWLFLLLGSVALLAIFLQRQVARPLALPLTIRLCLLLTFFAFCFWLF